MNLAVAIARVVLFTSPLKLFLYSFSNHGDNVSVPNIDDIVLLTYISISLFTIKGNEV